MEIGEAHTLRAELVQIWRLEKRMSMSADVAVALVIGQNDDDVGLARRVCCGGQRRKQQGGE